VSALGYITAGTNERSIKQSQPITTSLPKSRSKVPSEKGLMKLILIKETQKSNLTNSVVKSHFTMAGEILYTLRPFILLSKRKFCAEPQAIFYDYEKIRRVP